MYDAASLVLLRARLRQALPALLALALPACGSSSTTPVTPTGPGPNAQEIYSENISMAAATNVNYPAIDKRDVAVPGAGTVNTVLDWNVSTNDLDQIITDTNCPDGIAAYNGRCTVLDSSRAQDRTAAKPSQVQFTLSAAQTIRIWIYNFGKAEEGPLKVYLTP